eukprot:Sdes_comp18315_c0_seq1m8032
MSLAEELLADLESEEDEEEEGETHEERCEKQKHRVNNLSPPDFGTNLTPKPCGAFAEAAQNRIPVREIARVLYSRELEEVIAGIQHQNAHYEGQRQILGPVEEDAEYKLIVKANDLSVKIDADISVLHKLIRDIFAARFPELEQLVPNPLDYIKTVRLIGAHTDITQVDLSAVLSAATIMVVNVAAATSSGRVLGGAQQGECVAACEAALKLEAHQKTLLVYVESRMNLVAPNLSAIISTGPAAKLMAIAGGLTALSKMPACNVQVLGSQKQTIPGLSAASSLRHCGLLYFTDLVQSAVADVRMKVCRKVAAKCSLAARVDSFHECFDGSIGRRLRAQIEEAIEELQQAVPAKSVKALKVPDEGPKKRRGGKRVRRMKEKYATTEYQKAANRMSFGRIQEDINQGDLGFSLGQAHKGEGRLRAPPVDAKTKISVSKRLQRELAGQKARGGGTVTSGFASVAFTPVQGFEIVRG